MTYCLALQLEGGLVFAADTRTNAGVDYVTSYRKIHVFRPLQDRLLVLLSAGNLATTTELVDTLGRDLTLQATASLATCRSLSEAAAHVGALSQQIQDRHRVALANSGVSGDITLILGGQIGDEPPQLHLIYPQGNYISASPDTPYLQIGESKYGKPMLDRILKPDTSLADGARLALVSLDATVRSNLTVGPPFDLAICPRDRFDLDPSVRIESDSPFYQVFRDSWQQGLDAAFRELPRFDWERAETP
jgi:putative proteasome-type protease